MKANRNRLLGSVAALCLSLAARAAAPTGSWSIDANGFSGTLLITSVTGDGKLTGTLYGDTIQGYWNDNSQRLVLFRVVGNQDSGIPPTNAQVFEGYQFPASTPNGTMRLAGTFQFFSSTGATGAKNVEGWYAFKR